MNKAFPGNIMFKASFENGTWSQTAAAGDKKRPCLASKGFRYFGRASEHFFDEAFEPAGHWTDCNELLSAHFARGTKTTCFHHAASPRLEQVSFLAWSAIYFECNVLAFLSYYNLSKMLTSMYLCN
jgi:hypothetical protein